MALTKGETEMNTAELWTETHKSLCSQDWTVARRLLDELAARRDNRHWLGQPEAYGVPANAQPIRDRIALVNQKAG